MKNYGTSKTTDLKTATFGALVAKTGMDVCYLFIEKSTTRIEDIIMLESDQVFEHPEDTLEEYKRLVEERAIDIYIPGGPPEGWENLRLIRKGYLPWDDSDKVIYYVCEKGDIVVKKYKDHVEQKKQEATSV